MILSGNTCFWQVRFDEDHRTMTCFKYLADQDPVVGTPDERFLTGPWSDRRIANPETSTIGLTFTRGGYSRYGLGVPRGSGAYTVWRPEHWAFEGTDLRYGDELGRDDTIVAYEVDGCELATGPDGLPVPTHADGAPEDLEILATAPARLWKQDEQPSRYAHEPGELENTAMAVFGPGLARPGASRHEQPRLHRRCSPSPAAARCSTPASPIGRTRWSPATPTCRASPAT